MVTSSTTAPHARTLAVALHSGIHRRQRAGAPRTRRACSAMTAAVSSGGHPRGRSTVKAGGTVLFPCLHSVPTAAMLIPVRAVKGSEEPRRAAQANADRGRSRFDSHRGAPPPGQERVHDPEWNRMLEITRAGRMEGGPLCPRPGEVELDRPPGRQAPAGRGPGGPLDAGRVTGRPMKPQALQARGEGRLPGTRLPGQEDPGARTPEGHSRRVKSDMPIAVACAHQMGAQARHEQTHPSTPPWDGAPTAAGSKRGRTPAPARPSRSTASQVPRRSTEAQPPGPKRNDVWREGRDSSRTERGASLQGRFTSRTASGSAAVRSPSASGTRQFVSRTRPATR